MNQQNRLFMIIAVGLVVLLGIGLLGIGGWALVIRPRQRAVQAETTATRVAMAETATSTSTATLVPPATNTPRPTNTPVVGPATNTPTAAPVPPQPTDTPAPAEPTPTPTPMPETTPQTGFGPGVALIAGFGLVVLVFGFRRLRQA